MKLSIAVFCGLMLVACSPAQPAEVLTETETTIVQEFMTELPTDITEQDIVATDTVYGVPCYYIDGSVEISELKCAKGEVIAEWKTPADGWNTTVEDEMIHIDQVYYKEVLLLPHDYGSNTHHINGLDAELLEDNCSPCPDESEESADAD